MIIASGQRVTADFLRRVYGTDWDTWTPTVSGGGSATFSAGGEWTRIGEKRVLFTVNFTVTATGSGAASLTWTLPTAPSRSRRWIFPGAAEGISWSGLHAVTFTSGSGLTVDRIRYAGATNLIGSALTATNILFQFTGQYREA
ncbi:hypothetical protein [Micromonospora carbonacea]|uniref:hypothetical protein n=1 Tax=Micromonospora carbonacea TaxID=47853 RepID=UPI00371825A6